jgi:hypothetical protein
MKGTKRGIQEPVISSKRAAPAPAVPKNSFSIFVDEKFASENIQQKENQLPKAVPSAIPKAAAPANPKLAAGTRQPLAPAPLHPLIPPASAAPDAENRKPETAAYKSHILSNATDGSEQCFEEYRVAIHLIRKAEKERMEQKAKTLQVLWIMILLKRLIIFQANPSARSTTGLVAQAMIDDSSRYQCQHFQIIMHFAK